MSHLLYLAADLPLAQRKNPHERTLSVNEALALGLTQIPDFLLEEGFDRDAPDVLLYSDREVFLDADSGTVTDGDFDDDFAVLPMEKLFGMHTEKEHCASVEWRFTPGRAEQLIGYLKEQLSRMPEVELWHTWLDEEPRHRLRQVSIPISQLTVEDIAELERQEVWQEPPTDYCFLLTR